MVVLTASGEAKLLRERSLRLGRAAPGACVPKSFLGGALFYGMIDSEKLSLGFRLAVVTPALIEDFVRNRE